MTDTFPDKETLRIADEWLIEGKYQEDIDENPESYADLRESIEIDRTQDD